MRKILSVVMVNFMIISNGFGLVSRPTVWELRTTATSGNLNGCGFNPAQTAVGTDYTQQDAAQVTYTDLVIGAAGNTVTSVASPFTADLVGNILHITAGTGFTQGWHEIVAVAGGIATLFSSAGTAASTGGTASVGGACSMNSSLDDDFFEVLAPSNVVHVKVGVYTIGEVVTVATDAFNTAKVKIIGYNSTREDDPTFANSPTFAGGSNGMTFTGDFFDLYNFNVTGTASPSFQFGGGSTIYKVNAKNTSTAASRSAIILNGANNMLLFGDFETTSFAGIGFGSGSQYVIGNYVHHSTIGINLSTVDNNVVLFNLIETIASTGIFLGAGSVTGIYAFNTIYGSSTPRGAGISIGASSTGNLFHANNIVNFSTGIFCEHGFLTNNFIGNNFFGNSVNMSTTVSNGIGHRFLDPGFISTTTSNYTPTKNIIGIALPGAFGVSASTGFLDIGAIQRRSLLTTGHGIGN